MRNLAFTLISQKHEKQVKNRHGSIYEQTFDALKLVLKYNIVELVHILGKIILIEASHLLLYVLFKKIIAESFALETSLAPKLKPRKIIILGKQKIHQVLFQVSTTSIETTTGNVLQKKLFIKVSQYSEKKNCVGLHFS